MRDISKDELKEILRKHTLWVECKEGGERTNLVGAHLREADLRGANLVGADLWGASLWGADLVGANLDYSCWPLWCGSLDVKVDIRIAAQLAYHFCRLVCDDPAYIQARNVLVPLANTFHRADECGRLEILEAGK